VNFTLRVTRDEATPQIERMIREAKRPRAIVAAGIRAVYNFLRKHFRALDRSNPNKLGGTRQHFWRQVEMSTNTPVITDTNGVVTVSDPRYAFKVEGGTITAKRAKMLTIPVSREAYGRRASVLEQERGIKLIALRLEGRGVLAEILPTGGIIVHYALKPSVTISADPNALPDMDEMSDIALQAASSAAARQMNAS
jgi:hypothetical protein